MLCDVKNGFVQIKSLFDDKKLVKRKSPEESVPEVVASIVPPSKKQKKSKKANSAINAEEINKTDGSVNVNNLSAPEEKVIDTACENKLEVPEAMLPVEAAKLGKTEKKKDAVPLVKDIEKKKNEKVSLYLNIIILIIWKYVIYTLGK
jgi:hypothetical protein